MHAIGQQSEHTPSRGETLANSARPLLDLYRDRKSRRALPDLDSLRSMIDQNPNVGELHYYKAVGLFNNKQYEESIKEYDIALSIGAIAPQFRASCKYDQACALALLERKEEAISKLKESVSAGFRDLAHLRTDADLTSLHSHKDWEELSATKDTSKMSRVEGWRYDLWFLNRELRRIHYRFDNSHSVQEWDSLVKEIHDGIPKWSDERVQMELKRLTVMAGDGHTALGVFGPTGTNKLGSPAYYAPIKIDECADGPMVTGATHGYSEWLGWKLTKVEGLPYQDFRRTFAQYISQDNDMGVAKMIPRYAMNTSFLYGANISSSPKSLKVSLVNPSSGKTAELSLPCSATTPDYQGPIKDYSNVRWLKNRSKFYWFEMIPGTKTVYWQYNSVLVDAQEPVEAFADRLGKFINDNNAEKLIVDLRLNGGGNNQTYRSLIKMLVKSPINEFGRLYVIIGRNTFSAAQCFATEVERDTDAIFVGEPSGSRPNFIGESIPFELPYSKLRGQISDLYWQKGQAFDYRMWIAPQIPALNTYAEFAAGEDVAIDAILACPITK